MHSTQKQLQVEKPCYAELVFGWDNNKLVYLVASKELPELKLSSESLFGSDLQTAEEVFKAEQSKIPPIAMHAAAFFDKNTGEVVELEANLTQNQIDGLREEGVYAITKEELQEVYVGREESVFGAAPLAVAGGATASSISAFGYKTAYDYLEAFGYKKKDTSWPSRGKTLFLQANTPEYITVGPGQYTSFIPGSMVAEKGGWSTVPEYFIDGATNTYTGAAGWWEKHGNVEGLSLAAYNWITGRPTGDDGLDMTEFAHMPIMATPLAPGAIILDAVQDTLQTGVNLVAANIHMIQGWLGDKNTRELIEEDLEYTMWGGLAFAGVIAGEGAKIATKKGVKVLGVAENALPQMFKKLKIDKANKQMLEEAVTKTKHLDIKDKRLLEHAEELKLDKKIDVAMDKVDGTNKVRYDVRVEGKEPMHQLETGFENGKGVNARMDVGHPVKAEYTIDGKPIAKDEWHMVVERSNVNRKIIQKEHKGLGVTTDEVTFNEMGELFRKVFNIE